MNYEKKLFEIDLEKIVAISKEFDAKKILLFGSCLDDIESARDIDIAVSGINPKEFFRYYGKVSIAVKDEVDIINLDDIREHLYKRIISDGKIVYER
ncbi:MAG: nucleotidyltransferase family protein [Candidatus Anammoxibacter sp.]